MTERTIRVLIVCITVFLLAIVAVVYDDCSASRRAREKCMEQHSLGDCRVLFPASGDRR